MADLKSCLSFLAKKQRQLKTRKLGARTQYPTYNLPAIDLRLGPFGITKDCGTPPV
jgi:hypothetical protein